jgi:hypothetical protein
MSCPNRELKLAKLSLDIAKERNQSIKSYEAQCITSLERISAMLNKQGRELQKVQIDRMESERRVEHLSNVVRDIEEKYSPIDLCDDDDSPEKVRPSSKNPRKQRKRKTSNNADVSTTPPSAETNPTRLVVTGVDWMVNGIYDKTDYLFHHCPTWRKNFSHEDWGDASSVIYKEINYGVLSTWIIALMPRDCNPDDKKIQIKRFFWNTCSGDEFPPNKWQVFQPIGSTVQITDKIPVIHHYKGWHRVFQG